MYFRCVGFFFLFLTVAVYGQAAIRRRLGDLQATLPFKWNITVNPTFALPPRMHGIYSVPDRGMSIGDVYTDLAEFPKWTEEEQIQYATHRLERKDTKVTVDWDCVLYGKEGVENYEKTPNLPFSVEFDADINANVLKADSSRFTDEKTTVHCRVIPEFHAPYRELHERWKDALELMGRFNHTLLYGQADVRTKWPWHPFPDPTGYIDNELIIYVPARPSAEELEAARIASLDTDSYEAVDPSQIAVKLHRATEYANLHISSIRGEQPLYVHNCEELLNMETAAEATSGKAIAIANALIDTRDAPDDLFQPTRVKWEFFDTPVLMQQIPSLETMDQCHADYSTALMHVFDDKNARKFSVVFSNTTHSPEINNPLVRNHQMVPPSTQCLVPFLAHIVHVLEKPLYSQMVMGRHVCQQNPFPTSYSWQWAPIQRKDDYARQCVNNGKIYHNWYTQACGKQATSQAITEVADTNPPRVDFSQPYVRAPSATTDYISYSLCYWPSAILNNPHSVIEATRFCPKDTVERAVRALLHDDCDNNAYLRVNVDWIAAVWSVCHLNTDTGKSTCAPHPQLDGPGSRLRCYQEMDFVSMLTSLGIRSDNSRYVLQYSVPVRFSDTCGNNGPHAVVFSVTFVEPVKLNSVQFVAQYCPR